VGYIL